MSIFTPLARLLSPSQPSRTPEKVALPYDLTAADWAKLKTLVSEPGWPVLLRVLDAEAKLDGERLLQTSNTEALHFIRGHVSGLRKAASVISEISRQEERVVRERERIEAERARERPGRAAAFFGSPGWRSGGDD